MCEMPGCGYLKCSQSYQAAIGACNGNFWKSFRNCPQAALASKPRVTLTLAVTFRLLRVSTNASTYKEQNNEQHKLVAVQEDPNLNCRETQAISLYWKMNQ